MIVAVWFGLVWFGLVWLISRKSEEWNDSAARCGA